MAEKEVRKMQAEVKQDLGDVIAANLADVIRRPQAMKNMEAEVDAWIIENRASITGAENKKQLLASLNRGKQALESIFIRVNQSVY